MTHISPVRSPDTVNQQLHAASGNSGVAGVPVRKPPHTRCVRADETVRNVAVHRAYISYRRPCETRCHSPFTAASTSNPPPIDLCSGDEHGRRRRLA